MLETTGLLGVNMTERFPILLAINVKQDFFFSSDGKHLAATPGSALIGRRQCSRALWTVQMSAWTAANVTLVLRIATKNKRCPSATKLCITQMPRMYICSVSLSDNCKRQEIADVLGLFQSISISFPEIKLEFQLAQT